MRKNENKLMRRRLVNAYLSSVVSISLVLLLVGVAAMLLVNTRSVSEFFKENLQVSVMMKQEVSDEEAAVFKNEIDSMRFVRNAELITKARGEKEMAEMLGTDFLSVFETSPIPVSIVVTLDADYVSRDSLKIVEKAMMKSPMRSSIRNPWWMPSIPISTVFQWCWECSSP